MTEMNRFTWTLSEQQYMLLRMCIQTQLRMCEEGPCYAAYLELLLELDRQRIVFWFPEWVTPEGSSEEGA